MPDKPPLKPPSSPRPLISFALGGPETQPLITLPNTPLPPPPQWMQGLGHFAAAYLGLEGDPTAPPGTAPPSWPVLAGMAAGMLPGPRSLGALGRGLYSRVDEALKLLPVKGAHPNKVLSILKSNASAEELAFRKVPEWLAAQGNTPVTPERLAAHLQAHPAPVPKVVTRGDAPADLIAARKTVEDRAKIMQSAAFDDPKDWVGVDQVSRSNAFWWAQEAARGDERALRKLKDIAVDPDHLETLLSFGRLRNEASGIAFKIAEVPTTKYGNYTVPGGQNYKETLLTLPDTTAATLDARRREIEGLGRSATPAQKQEWADIMNQLKPETRDVEGLSKFRGRPEFRSSHFDEPNIVVHTRSNERTLPTGERGRFVEEVQSDWHQAGKKRGYGPDQRVVAYYEVPNGGIVPVGYGKTEAAALADTDPKWKDLVTIKYKTETLGQGVPDAPFKETWPDLGLKQNLLETAADPEASWLGFTSGQTQAARYDLRKHIDEIHYQPGQERLLAFDKHADKAIDQIVPADKLADYIGKDAAEKLLAQPFDNEYRTSHVLRGADLQTGGEGMQYFYDQLLRKRLEKIVKPFGGTVERGALGARTKAQIDAEIDALHLNPPPGPAYGEAITRLTAERNAAPDADAWIARLTPEMKARIQREGLPLMSLVPLSQVGAPPREDRR